MAKTSKRSFIRIDDHIWTHDEFRALSPTAGLAFIFMIAWSNAAKLDGIVTPLGASFTAAGPAEIQELLKAGFIEHHERGWRIVKFGEWQLTNSEWDAVSATAATNGQKGGIAKKTNQDLAAGSSAPPIPGDPREEWMAAAFERWPAPGKGFSFESPLNIRPAFMASVQTEKDWEEFQAALESKLHRYETNPEPRDKKRRFLGSFKNFCFNWRDEMVIVAVEKRPPPPPPPKATAPKYQEPEV